MASPAPRRTSVGPQATTTAATTDDHDLAQSLQHLSLSASSPARSPRPARPHFDRSPSAPRSPLHGPSSSSAAAAAANGFLPSRSATPTLLRKASLNSLHSSAAAAAAPHVPARRASSVHLMSPARRTSRSPLRGLSPEPPRPPAPPAAAPTPASVARDFFERELPLHAAAAAAAGHHDHDDDVETLVVLHDACYGHRYARPRTSRAALRTIVERPERLKASVLGVSAAYVRLGERHAGGAHAPHPQRDPAAAPVPFRIRKTDRRLSLLSPAVTNVHGTRWMEELALMCDSAEAKLAMNGKELQRPSDLAPARGGGAGGSGGGGGPGGATDAEAPPKLHEGDLYLCAESRDAMEGALGGVCEAVDAVFAGSTGGGGGGGGPRRAFVAIRPPGHHCSASYPSGFCWVNNVHVGIMHAILSHGLTHAAIVDFDLHHGDGSQAIAWHHNARAAALPKNAAGWKKTAVGYFSLHDINSYPCEAGDEDKVKNASLCIDNAHGQAVWNVHLRPWATDAEFARHYESAYAQVLERARGFLRSRTARLRAAGLPARAAIFLSAGFDASEWEGAGMQRHDVNVPTAFYARFTRDVVRLAADEATAVEGRIVSVLEGGYSDRALCSGILSHLCGLAGDDPAVRARDWDGLGCEMGRRLGGASVSSALSLARKDSSASERGTRPYDPSWWAASELDSLEALVAPPPPPPDASKPSSSRRSTPPTYSSPTQSSAAKVVTAVPKVRRSMSGLSATNGSGSSLAPSRPPTPPPPPEVPWTVATHELSKLLIPSDRQTDSCRHEDLSAEATRARRDRQSALAQQQQQQQPSGLPASAAAHLPSRMALRERRAKPPTAAALSLAEEDEEQQHDAKSRRKTVAGTAAAADRSAARQGQPLATKPANRPGGRRLSAASTVVPETAAASLSVAVPPPPAPASASAASRPHTAQSIRPESSMSGRAAATAAAGVPGAAAATAAKKARTGASAAAKKDGGAPQRAPRGQKKRMVSASADSTPVLSSRRAADLRAVSPSPSLAKSTTAATAAAAAAGSQPSDAVDRLASDMKKIKITLVTKEQREARQRERAQREGAAATTQQQHQQQQQHQHQQQSVSLPVTPAAVVTLGDPILDEPLAEPLAEPAGTAPATPHVTIEPAWPPALASEAVVPPSPARPQETPVAAGPCPSPSKPWNLRSSPVKSDPPATPQRATPDLFVPYQPEGPAPATLPPQQPLQWLPPNSATPMPARRAAADLPVFTSTSAIPFAAAPRPASPPPPQQQHEDEGPARTARTAEAEVSGGPSVWDVPETPLR